MSSSKKVLKFRGKHHLPYARFHRHSSHFHRPMLSLLVVDGRREVGMLFPVLQRQRSCTRATTLSHRKCLLEYLQITFFLASQAKSIIHRKMKEVEHITLCSAYTHTKRVPYPHTHTSTRARARTSTRRYTCTRIHTHTGRQAHTLTRTPHLICVHTLYRRGNL
jgi:hypothetical protein